MKIVVLALGIILLSAFGLYGCGGRKELTRLGTDEELLKLQKLKPISENGLPDDENSSPLGVELVALANTLEEAEEIAELYGIELNSYSYGVATYITDKNIQELMEFGVENDYPALTPNYESELYTEQ